MYSPNYQRISKIFFAIFISWQFSYCMVANTLDLNPGHVSGKEAKQIIRDKFKSNFLLHSLMAVASASANTVQGKEAAQFYATKATIDSLKQDMLFIDESKYYKRKDVEICADRLWEANLFTHSLDPFICHLTPDKDL